MFLGANVGGSSDYLPDVTSYDYDAPMNEAGDPTTKYFAIRNEIGQHLPLPKIEVPEKYPKMGLPSIQLRFVTTLLSDLSRSQLSTKTVSSKTPLTFEELHQNTGFVLYETIFPTYNKSECQLTVNGLRDSAHVLMNGVCFHLKQVNRSNILIIRFVFFSTLLEVYHDKICPQHCRFTFQMRNL